MGGVAWIACIDILVNNSKKKNEDWIEYPEEDVNKF